MKEIKLTQGKVALVDDEDFEYLNQWKWCAAKNNKTTYAQREGRDGKVVKMHRAITNPKEGFVVDHIDNNGLNNTKANLRVCTKKENNRNKSVSRNNILGVKGVTKDGNKFRARIRVNNKIISLGSFQKITEAIASYNKAASLFFGEFHKPSAENTAL